MPQTYSLSSFPTYKADQPLCKLAKLQYTCIENIPNLGAGALYSRIFRANDLYDPDYAVGGHQPYGFDQIMAQYNHFTVLYSKCELELTDNVEYKNVIYRVWLTSTFDELSNAFAAGPQALVELPRHSESLTQTIGSYKGKDRTVSMTFDAPRFFNKTSDSIVGDSNFQGSAAASPTEDAFFIIGGYHPTAAAVAFTDHSLRVTITYYAVFTEPKRMVPS